MSSATSDLQERLQSFIRDPAARRDPYPFYREIRETTPVVQTPDGTWWVFDYANCLALIRDKRWSNENPAASQGKGCLMGFARSGVSKTILFRDAPDHTRLRGLLGRLFTLPAAEKKRSQFRMHIEHVLLEAAGNGEVDFKEGIARIVPMYMICDLLGLPQERYEELVRWANSFTSMLAFDVTPELEAAADREFLAFSEYLRPFVDARKAEPREDLLSEWVKAHAQGRLTEQEVTSYALFTVAGGQSTTTNTITNALYLMKRHPEQWLRFLSDPEGLKDTAAEEVLRFETAARLLVPRWATEDIELGGITIPKGAMVIANNGAANRDPAVFTDPETFDIGRTPNRHLAFGVGSHGCAGQSVARVEIQEVLAAIALLYPGIQIGEPGKWIDEWIIRGLSDLPVTLDPGSKARATA